MGAYANAGRAERGESRASVGERVQRQLSTYWRVRIAKSIENLEREARRMLQLEGELSQFAAEYYAAVGDAVAQLHSVEYRLEQQAAPTPTIPELSDVVLQCEAREQRQVELKSRYRSLAKEIHPDRAMAVSGTGEAASRMHQLNAAYEHGDLAALLRLEAQLMLTKLSEVDFADTGALESALYEVDRAAATYADGYRALLASPLNELLLRAMAARMEGWDFMQAVLRKIERTIDEKERILALSAAAPAAANNNGNVRVAA